MKILITTTMLSLGGVESQILTLGQALRRLGVDFLVATQGLSGLMAEAFSQAKIRVKRYRTEEDLAQIAVSEGIDLIHAHPFENLRISHRVARNQGLPILTTLHSLPQARWPLDQGIGVDHIICVCDLVRDALKQAGWKTSKSSVIHNGLRVQDYPARTWGERPSRQAAYIGRTDQKQRLLAGLEKMLFSQGWSLRIIGGIAQSLPKRSSDRLLLPQEVPKALTEIDVVLGAGRSAMEGLASGAVVIVMNSTGYEGVVTPNNAQYLLESNFSARGPKRVDLSAQRLIADLRNAMTYRRTLGEFGQIFARVHLRIEDMAQAHLQVYQRLLGG